MEIKIPEFSLVVLIGAAGSGKTHLAQKHFLQTEVLSSDQCRNLVADDPEKLSVTSDAYDVLRYIAEKRLANRKLTVIDATNVKHEDRRAFIELAKKYHCKSVAIVLNVPESLCIERNKEREKRVRKNAVKQQRSALKRSLKHLKKDFKQVQVLKNVEDIDNIQFIREKLRCDYSEITGPFDIIGDIHGCYEELVELLEKLEYKVEGDQVTPPANRKAVFLGDLTDRGPNSVGVLKLVMNMVSQGYAYCCPGNHDHKLQRALRGNKVKIAHGLDLTLKELESESDDFKEAVKDFIRGLPSHYVFNNGDLVVAHAGLKEEHHNRDGGGVFDFAIFGEVLGMDEDGKPIRGNWAADYRGKATVVYGHTVVAEPEWQNQTINIDTGCAFGGELTALQYPERRLVSVPAKQQYADLGRPLKPKTLTDQQEADDILNLQDVITNRRINTELFGTVKLREDQAHSALEAITRFAVNPKWLIYLPPTMSPVEVSQKEDYLEYPTEAFEYFRSNGVQQIICEEKHMGSRAIAIVCKDKEVTRKRFGILDDSLGVCITRTGNSFFRDNELEKQFIERVRDGITKANLWEELNTDWVCLDAELMPWSAKARELIRGQYAAMGCAGEIALTALNPLLEMAKNRGINLEGIDTRFTGRLEALQKFTKAYEGYCWNTEGLEGIKFAPFHIMATEGKVYNEVNHLFHMQTLAKLAEVDELFVATPYHVVDLNDPAQEEAVTNWWIEQTNAGGEGMVVKPLGFTARGPEGIVQPAVKVRGREYLRIIYGPEYLSNLDKLKKRSLRLKRNMAMKEFAMGVEGLKHFVKRKPLREVHACAFGVLALEREPIDPRL